jgi:hypothetical protein
MPRAPARRRISAADLAQAGRYRSFGSAASSRDGTLFALTGMMAMTVAADCGDFDGGEHAHRHGEMGFSTNTEFGRTLKIG